jgi:hypothetical protein
MASYGTRSEIERAGILDGAEIVRVDETLFKRRRIPLARYVLAR